MVRGFLAPFAVGLSFAVAAWAAGQATNLLWRPLSVGTLRLVRGLLSLVTRDVVCRPAEFLVGTARFRVRIEPGCSGYEGIGLILVFLGGYLWIFRRTLRFPQAFLLLPLGTVIIWLTNALRIAGLVAIGSWGSEAVALGGFHSQAGWLAFNAVGLGLVFMARRSHLFTVDVQPRNESGFASPTAAYLVPMLAIVATTMVTGAFTCGFDFLYPLRVPVALTVLWIYRRQYADLHRTWSWGAVLIGVVVFALWMTLETLHADSRSGTVLLDGLRGLPKGWAIVWLIFRVAGSVLTVPLAEELAFRGYLVRRLQSVNFLSVPPGHFTPLALLVSSILFGALHGRWLAGTVAGLLYAFAVRRRGNLTDAVVAHATTNALIAAHVLITGSWSLWV
jgi:exosortase E/protease (VPEID-CTERM system)